MIETPGIYDISEDEYHRDPCPSPSLSCSIAKLLLWRSPRHALFNHPRLNPADIPDDANKQMDLGAAAHKILLGKGAGLSIIAADDYRTKDARAARDVARASGKIPVLVAQFDQAQAMAAVALEFIEDILGDEWTDGVSERAVAWREGMDWCRGLIDRLFGAHFSTLDYKTTSMSAEPSAASANLYRSGFHFQAAFYERGLNTVDPANAGRRRFLFLFQETDPPYACSLLQPDEAGMTIARKQVVAAIQIWKDCLAKREWPGYPPGIVTAQMPSWMERQWLDREMSDPALTGETGVMPEYNPPNLYGPS